MAGMNKGLTNIEFDEKTLKIDQIVNFDKNLCPRNSMIL